MQNKDQFEVLFRRCYPQMMLTARMLLGDGGESEDIVSEIFTHVWEGSIFLPEENFSDMEYVTDLAKKYHIDVKTGIYNTIFFFNTQNGLLKADEKNYLRSIPHNIHNTNENKDIVTLYDEWRNGHLKLRCHSINSELVIHSNGNVPLCFFWNATICRQKHLFSPSGGITLFLILQHQNVCGNLELSTDGSWENAREELSINTCRGFYLLQDMESLTFQPRLSSFMGLPMEKITHHDLATFQLFKRNGVNPLLVNNALYTQGFYTEIHTFAELTEKRSATNCSDLESMKDTFSLMEQIKSRIV